MHTHKILNLNFTPFPLLETERLILRATVAGDVDEIFYLRSNAEVMKHIRKAPAATTDDAMAYIDRVNNSLASNGGISWAISLKDNTRLIGCIGLWRIEKEHYRGEIGYMLHPEQQGKGLMDEAMKAVLDYGFNVIGLHSVEGQINPTNIASQKILERNGFIREAYFRESYYYNGVFGDYAVYSLLKPDK